MASNLKLLVVIDDFTKLRKSEFYYIDKTKPDWLITSNRESGDGFSDIMIKPEDPDAGIVIEVKYAKEIKELDKACEAAMAQINDKRYDEALRDEGRCDILAYGIAFCRKRCKVKLIYKTGISDDY